MRDFLRSGSHSWEAPIEYHRCTHCGFVSEDRKFFEKRAESLEKEVLCHRCQQKYVVKKEPSQALGPLL